MQEQTQLDERNAALVVQAMLARMLTALASAERMNWWVRQFFPAFPSTPYRAQSKDRQGRCRTSNLARRCASG